MRAGLALALLLSYPVAIHLLITTGYANAATAVVLAASVISLIAAWRGARRRGRWMLVFAAFALVGLLSLFARSPLAMFLPPVAINLVLAAVFARSLAPGNVSVLERLIAIAQPRTVELTPHERNMARRLTGVWVAFFTSMAIVSVVLAVFAPLKVWSLFTNVVYFLLIPALILLQHGVRVLRVGRNRAGSLRLCAARVVEQFRRGPVRAAHP